MSPSLFRVHGLFPEEWAPASRGSVILLFALMSGEGCGSPAQKGSRGWARHLCGGPGTAAKATFALTHPSNPRETNALTESGSIGQAFTETGSVGAATGRRDRCGVKTVPSRSNA